MAETTGIAWAHRTWSPWYGCAKVSAGCKFCYAEARSRRWKNPAVTGTWGPDGIRSICKDWRKPLRWDEEAKRNWDRYRVFPSLCDWLEERNDLIDARARFLELIDNTPHLDWLLLSKRVGSWRRLMQQIATLHRGSEAERIASAWLDGSPPANIWFGASTEDQENADERIPALLQIPASVRWVSYEPALGPIDFDPWLDCGYETGGPQGWISEPSIDWIVVGGESKQGGNRARPFRLEWARKTVYQGRHTGTPVFVKQLGSTPVDRGTTGDVYPSYISRAGADMEEWPADLRVREFPKAATSAA